jgi:hypothetical protein
MKRGQFGLSNDAGACGAIGIGIYSRFNLNAVTSQTLLWFCRLTTDLLEEKPNVSPPPSGFT